jgi:hypothetical protein
MFFLLFIQKIKILGINPSIFYFELFGVKIMNSAIALFVFNRPEHTKNVLEGLKKNEVNKIYVFCDGPRNEIEKCKTEKVQEVIKSVDWCEIEININTENKGLANSVINGVTNVFNKGYDAIIVLEDDCIPNENYIKYMNDAFDFYKDQANVMHISGFGLPIKKYTNADTYFTPYPCSWGWGTFAHHWNKCDFHQEKKYKELLNNQDQIRKFNYAGEAFSDFLKLQLEGKVNSWLIRWYFHIFMNNGKCVWSYKSLIKNKGFDGSGVHKNKFDRFNQKFDNNESFNITNFEQNIEYNSNLIKEFRRHFMGKKIIERIKTSIYLITGIIIGK